MDVDFIHIGMQKTGSTWLQRVYFPQHPNLDVYPLLHTSIIKENNNTKYQSTDTASDGIVVKGLTNENLCGHLVTADGMESIAESLVANFGQVKIFLVLRDPLTFIASAYSFEVKWGTPVPTFDDYLEKNTLSNKLDYKKLIGLYQALFGRENVLTLPYELFRKDKATFLKFLTDFLGVPEFNAIQEESRIVNSSYSIRTTKFLNGVNHAQSRINQLTNTPDRKLMTRATRGILKIPFVAQYDASQPRYKLRAEDLERYPGLKKQLQDADYDIWSGALSEYNYVF